MAERILVVEDSPIQAKALRILLESHGFELDVAASAEEAIERVRQNHVALVLSDIMLPGTDGFELCRRIKRELGLVPPPPLLLLTALDETADVARGLECGADGYLAKPYDSEELLERVRTLLKHKSPIRPGLADPGYQRHLLALVADTLVDRSDEAFYVLDRAWRFVYLNGAAERLLRRSADELVGRSVWDTFPEAVGTTAYTTYHRAFEGGATACFELFYAPLDTWFEVAAYPRGHFLVVHFRDVGRRKETEKALRESETRWRHLFEHNPLPAWIYDVETLRILEVNDAATVHYGYGRAEFLELTLEDLRSPDELPRLREALGQSARGGILRHSSRHWTKDGRIIDVEVTGQGAEWPNCEARLVVIQDVTERKRTRQALEEASAAKSRFLSVMGHELRTPLAAIVGFAELLEGETSGPLSEAQKAQARRIREGAWHLNNILEEVLSYARSEAKKEKVRPERTDLVALVRDVAAFIKPLADRTHIALQLRVPQEHVVVETDPGKLRQILLNLLGNAIKFTEAGEVVLTLTREGDFAIFRVSDTGPGIAPEDRERIFEPFEQGDASTTRTAGGTGLGLAVSRRLSRLLGGEITLQSELGQGSTFGIRLPLYAATPQS